MKNIGKKTETEDNLSQNQFPSPNSESYYEILQDNASYDFFMLEGEDDKKQDIVLDGEHKIINEKCTVINQNSRMIQNLYLTNYRIVVESQPIASIPYGYVQEVKKIDKTLKIALKTGIIVSLQFNQSDVQMRIVDLVQQQIYEKVSKLPFWFDVRINVSGSSEMITTYDSKAQIERMKVNSKQYSIFKNSRHQFCQSYPQYFLIPKGVKPNNLYEVKKCRYYSRIPIMSYYHAQKEVGLWRAAKLKDDLSGEVVKFDISYRRQIPGNPKTITLEQSSSVKNCESSLIFQPLPSLKVSFLTLVRTYSVIIGDGINPKDELYKCLSRWYQEIDKLITLSTHVVDLINVTIVLSQQQNNVIIEETYAFDRATQIMIISQIIIEPFFRTFDGLAILIEKQFVAFGHPFEDRSGFNKSKEYEVSPIFIQTLECIHQLIMTHPTCFEYSSAYLAHLGYELYTTKYKNFCNKTDAKKQKQFKNCHSDIWRKELRAKNHYNYHYNNQNTIKGLWQMRKKPSVKEYILWTDYLDMIAMMNGEKVAQYNSIKQAEDIKKYWQNKQKHEVRK